MASKLLLITCCGLAVALWSPDVATQEFPTQPTEDAAQDRGDPSAEADSEPASLPSPVRSGFWANVGFGGGSMGCSDCEERQAGAAAGFALGGTISPNLLLGGASNAWARVNDDDSSTTVAAATFMARYYPSDTDGFYLSGGLGFGQISVDNPNGDSSDDEGGSALIGLGYDVQVGDSWWITPMANWVGVVSADTDGDANFLQINVGVTWH